MQLKKIQNADIKNKKIFLRVDFNVGIESGNVKEAFKIAVAKETIDFLFRQKAKVALISHLGRPEGIKDPKFSLFQIADDVKKILRIKVKFVENCIGKKVRKEMEELSEKEIALLENVRFYKEDEANNPKFSQKLAENFDIFINDAFSVCHRDQASVTGVAKFLPSFAGLRLQKEILEMEKVKKGYSRPAVAIIGGAKIETKLPVIKFFENKYDFVLVGGKIANEANDKMIKFSEKVMLPVDYIGERMDIGPKTIEIFGKIISQAKTIVWNGPMGKFEEEDFAIGTRNILKSVVKSSAFTLVGGGETLEILEKNRVMDKIGFVSTGGGAMLEYLGGGKMPGIDILLLN